MHRSTSPLAKGKIFSSTIIKPEESEYKTWWQFGVNPEYAIRRGTILFGLKSPRETPCQPPTAIPSRHLPIPDILHVLFQMQVHKAVKLKQDKDRQYHWRLTNTAKLSVVSAVFWKKIQKLLDAFFSMIGLQKPFWRKFWFHCGTATLNRKQSQFNTSNQNFFHWCSIEVHLGQDDDTTLGIRF